MKKLFSIFCCLLLSLSIGIKGQVNNRKMPLAAYNQTFSWSEEVLSYHINLGGMSTNTAVQIDWYKGGVAGARPCLRIIFMIPDNRIVTIGSKYYPCNGTYTLTNTDADMTANTYWLYNNSAYYCMGYDDNGKWTLASGTITVSDGGDGTGKPYIVVNATSSGGNPINATIGSPVAAAADGTITVTPESNGQIKVGNGSYQSTTFSQNYAGGTELEIYAQGIGNYVFDKWSDGDMNNPRTVTIDGNATYTAQFVDKTVPLLGAYSYENDQYEIIWEQWGESEWADAYFTFFDAYNDPQQTEFIRLKIWDKSVLDNNSEATTYNNLQLCFWVSDFSQSYNGKIGPAENTYIVTQPEIIYTQAYASEYGYNNNLWGYIEESETFLDKVVVGCDPNKAIKDSYWNTNQDRIWTTAQCPYVAYFSKKNLSYGSPYDFYTIENGTTVKVERGKNDNAYVVATLPSGRILFTLGEAAVPATTYTITINTPTNGTITVMDGETTINNGDQVAEGTTLTVTTNPAADYHFSAWTDNGAASVTVDGPKTIGATFAQNDYFLNATYGEGGASVTRNDGGTNTTVKRAGNTVTLTPNAANGYEFVAWTGADADKVNNNVFTFPANGTHNTTYNVQATFQEITYTITYEDLNGATNNNPSSYTIATPTITLQNPGERTGYDFAGWTDDINGNTITQIEQGSTGNKTIYANWTEQTYTIIYRDKNNADYSGNNEGSLPTSHTYDVPTDLVDGTKGGFTFLGWFTDENCTVSAGSTIAANSITADITLYADWKERVTPEIELNDNITDISEYESILTTYAGQEVNVTLAGRTLAANRWHTLCLPFDYDTDGSALDGRVYELNDCTTDATNGMTITFYPAEYNTQREADIIAGRPYLVWIDQAVTTPLRFEGVTLTTFTPQTVSKTDVDFKANIPQQTLTNKADIFINNNRLYYPKTSGGSILRAFRAYFHIKKTNGMSYAQPRVRIVAEGASGETMTVLETDIDAQAETRKYVEDGILIIEREGVRYDAQGKRMDK